MTTSIPNDAPRYAETGCYGPELIWSPECAEGFRKLMAKLYGRDCLHEPGEDCPLLDESLLGSTLKAWASEAEGPAVLVEAGRVVAKSVASVLEPEEARERAQELLDAASKIDGRPAMALLVTDAAVIARNLGISTGALVEAAAR